MGDVSDFLSRARGNAQALHQTIEAATDKDNDTARSDLQQAGATARHLAALLKAVAESQRNDARQYLKSAAIQLGAAGECVSDLAHATETQIANARNAMLGEVRESIQNINHAVASQRAAKAQES
jgi:hypothetical protein